MGPSFKDRVAIWVHGDPSLYQSPHVELSFPTTRRVFMWTFEVQSIEPIIVRPSPLFTVTSQSPFLDAELFGPHAVTARFSSQLRTHSHTSRFRGGCVLPGLLSLAPPRVEMARSTRTQNMGRSDSRYTMEEDTCGRRIRARRL